MKPDRKLRSKRLAERFGRGLPGWREQVGTQLTSGRAFEVSSTALFKGIVWKTDRRLKAA